MKPLVWLAICLAAIVGLSATEIPGWVFGAVVAVTLVLAVSLSATRFRHERNLARAIWRSLTAR